MAGNNGRIFAGSTSNTDGMGMCKQLKRKKILRAKVPICKHIHKADKRPQCP